MAHEPRPGGVGAMMDEYERAAEELLRVFAGVTEAEYAEIVDPDTPDPDCRSIQTMMSHVVGAAYAYSMYLREALGVAGGRPDNRPLERAEVEPALRAALAHTVETLEGRWQMPDADIMQVRFQVRWGPHYDLEQMMEHAIVHVLRHRRQLEKFLRKLRAGVPQ